MALINNNYVFVESESVNCDVESTSHPVEKGVELTDHIRRKPTTISISGKIGDVGNIKAYDILNNIKKLKNSFNF